jgi:hypothetical protein
VMAAPGYIDCGDYRTHIPPVGPPKGPNYFQTR